MASYWALLELQPAMAARLAAAMSAWILVILDSCKLSLPGHELLTRPSTLSNDAQHDKGGSDLFGWKELPPLRTERDPGPFGSRMRRRNFELHALPVAADFELDVAAGPGTCGC